jgi:hypothetical protein
MSNPLALCDRPIAMTDDTSLSFDLPAVGRKKLTVDFNGGTQSSGAGLLLLRESERKLGVYRSLHQGFRRPISLSRSGACYGLRTPARCSTKSSASIRQRGAYGCAPAENRAPTC